jgi:type IX secretion system PorP/SprF family membrane protein
MKRICNIILVNFIIIACCSGQETSYGPGFHTALVNNPGFSGAEGNGNLKMSYLNFLPGNGYRLNSFVTSFDSYFNELHGGAALWVADDKIGGIMNDLHGGFSYAYFLRAGKDLYIHAGLSASLYHRGFDFSKSVLPDQIDPFTGSVLPSSENLTSRGRSAIDIGTGLMFIFHKLYGGISLNHLTRPEISPEGTHSEKLSPKLTINIAGDLSGINEKIEIKPTGYIGIQGNFLEGGAGTSIGNSLISFNIMMLGDNSENLNFQPGFFFHTGRLGILYNYRFNIYSENKMMPLSLLHQIGLSLSLYDVDKRNDSGFISFPKM